MENNIIGIPSLIALLERELAELKVYYANKDFTSARERAQGIELDARALARWLKIKAEAK
jgi:hypothetical protein